jgi:hypothetical protein
MTSPFWWQQGGTTIKAPLKTGAAPMPKAFEFGYDEASDMRGNIENLRGLYETGSKSTKRIARLALEPLLLAQGMSPYDFNREFPPIEPDPTPLDEALLNIDKMNEMVKMFAKLSNPGAAGPDD